MVRSLVNGQLDKLREEILSCNRCTLNRSRVNHGLWKLPGFGHPSAEVIFVAEAPSATGGCREGLYYSTTNSVFYWYLKEAGFNIPIDRLTISALGRLSRQEKKLEILAGRRKQPEETNEVSSNSRTNNRGVLDIELVIQDIREKRRRMMQPIYEAFTQELLYASDVVRCPSYDPDLDANCPLPKESIEQCLDFLLRELEIIKPKVICAMGIVATKVLTGISNLEQARSMNIVKSSECSLKHGIDVFPTYFPTAMRPEKAKIEDLRFLRRHLGL